MEKIIPNHILIEGDNLHALTALSFTHEGKIDVMYRRSSI
jgi:adenine-specific DNA-methyltransferase